MYSNALTMTAWEEWSLTGKWLNVCHRWNHGWKSLPISFLATVGSLATPIGDITVHTFSILIKSPSIVIHPIVNGILFRNRPKRQWRNWTWSSPVVHCGKVLRTIALWPVLPLLILAGGLNKACLFCAPMLFFADIEEERTQRAAILRQKMNQIGTLKKKVFTLQQGRLSEDLQEDLQSSQQSVLPEDTEGSSSSDEDGGSRSFSPVGTDDANSSQSDSGSDD